MYKDALTEMRESNLVIAVKWDRELTKHRIFCIKDRYGEHEQDMPISEVLNKILFCLDDHKLEEALTSVIEKIKIYETFK